MWWCKKLDTDIEGWTNPLFLTRHSSTPHRDNDGNRPYQGIGDDYYSLYFSPYRNNYDLPDYDFDITLRLQKIKIPDVEFEEVKGSLRDEYALRRRLMFLDAITYRYHEFKI